MRELHLIWQWRGCWVFHYIFMMQHTDTGCFSLYCRWIHSKSLVFICFSFVATKNSFSHNIFGQCLYVHKFLCSNNLAQVFFSLNVKWFHVFLFSRLFSKHWTNFGNNFTIFLFSLFWMFFNIIIFLVRNRKSEAIR